MLYWFPPFIKFGPLPSGNPRCAAAAHTRITTTTNSSPTMHILKTLRKYTTIYLPSTSTSTPLCTSPKTSPLPTIPNQPSITRSKLQITPSKHTFSQSEHLPFTFYFIPNHPNYISKLTLPMNLARLCKETHYNVESSIIKIVEDYLTRQNKHETGNENKTSNKKVLNYQPRFTSREHKPTSPINTFPPTNTTTATQTTQPGFKHLTPTTTTQYTQPTQKNHASTCTKPQLLHKILLPFIANQTHTIH